MGLMDSLKKADEQARQSAQRGKQRAGELWEDVERRVRRSWRIFPRRSEVRAPSSPSAPAGGTNKPAA
jgi:hypothetical protein